MLNMIYGDFADKRWLDQRESNVIDGGAPFYNVYQCSDEKWLAFAAIEQQFYQAFIEASTLPVSLLEQQWQRDLWPSQHQVLEQYFAGDTRDAWIARFSHLDICLAPVLSLAEAQAHPHNLAREAFVTRDNILQSGAAPHFSRTPSRIQGSPLSPPGDLACILQRWGK